MEGKDTIEKSLRRLLSKEPRCKGPCLEYDYKKWQEISRPCFLPLVLNLSETVSFRWLKD